MKAVSNIFLISV